MPPGDHPDDPSRWVRELRRHHEGTLLSSERAVPVRFIVDGSTGLIAMPVEDWVPDDPHAVLFLPEERDDSLQVLLEFLPQEAPEAARDRWTAYHGEPRLRTWVSARIMGVRRGVEVCPDTEIRLVNALQATECRLLRTINAVREHLGAVCERLAGVRVAEACAVGIDPQGIDVRARFGIVRAEFPADLCQPTGSIECPHRAAEVIGILLSGSGEART